MPIAPQPPASPAQPDSEQDAPRKEIIYYALGSVENGLSGFFFNVINGVMIVALGMNPVLLGLILGIKTLWDGAIDPFIAQWSDKTRSRWGRRRPFIFVGGVGRLLLLVAIFALFPRDGSIKSNADFAAEKAVHEEKAAHAAAGMPANPPVTPGGELTAPVQESAPAPAAPAPLLKKKPKPGMI
ncbi:MAG: MFS transporter, partial [Verrucomicrobiota bacterium]